MRILCEQMGRGHQHAGSADAALRAAAFKECFLERMKLRIDGQAFDGFDTCAAGLKDRHEATIHQFTVHTHGARSAFAFAAAFLGSGEAKVFAQDVEEPFHGRYIDG